MLTLKQWADTAEYRKAEDVMQLSDNDWNTLEVVKRHGGCFPWSPEDNDHWSFSQSLRRLNSAGLLDSVQCYYSEQATIDKIIYWIV